MCILGAPEQDDDQGRNHSTCPTAYLTHQGWISSDSFQGRVCRIHDIAGSTELSTKWKDCLSLLGIFHGRLLAHRYHGKCDNRLDLLTASGLKMRKRSMWPGSQRKKVNVLRYRLETEGSEEGLCGSHLYSLTVFAQGSKQSTENEYEEDIILFLRVFFF